MKNSVITLVVAIAVSLAAFGVSYSASREPALRRAAAERDAMAWLHTEFHLDDAQFAAVKKMHDDYGVVCSGHCAAIMAAKKRGAPASEISALEKTCVDAMTAHFRRVAASMPTGEGERYLATVLPRVEAYDHSGSPNLQVKP